MHRLSRITHIQQVTDPHSPLHVEVPPLMSASIKHLNPGQKLPFLLCSSRTKLAWGP